MFGSLCQILSKTSAQRFFLQLLSFFREIMSETIDNILNGVSLCLPGKKMLLLKFVKMQFFSVVGSKIIPIIFGWRQLFHRYLESKAKAIFVINVNQPCSGSLPKIKP